MKTKIFIVETFFNENMFGEFNNFDEALKELQKLQIEKGWIITEVKDGIIDNQYTVYIYIE